LLNGEDDHRCLHCGRRITGTVIAAPAPYIGATALAIEPAAEAEVVAARAQNPQQPPLFQPIVQRSPQAPKQNIIPFEEVQRQAAGRFASQQPIVNAIHLPGVPERPVTRKPAAHPKASSKRSAPPVGQGNFDFRPGVGHERVLKTGVPAQVYGDSRVAPPMRRFTAGAMDAAMVLIGFGVFVASVKIAGPIAASYLTHGTMHSVSFGSGKTLLGVLAGSVVLIALLYGLVWALARRETAGMRWTQLQLVTFDGMPLDGQNRMVRFVSAWLSYCSGGLGLLWALADEENLAFHDHISKTFPAEKASSRSFVRQRG
jgi:uncharacterized RDD family membrane protein YckC